MYIPAIILLLAMSGCIAAWQRYRKLRNDLRRAAALLCFDYKNREDWWKVRLRSKFVDHERERDRQKRIVEQEKSFKLYLRNTYGNPDDEDWETYTTGNEEINRQKAGA